MIGELSYFLGHQMKQLKNGTFMSQGKYIKDMLKKFDMNDSKSISTPMGTNENLDSDASGNIVDQKLYRSMIGSLLYVTTSRPDVMCQCMHVCKISSLTKRKSFEGHKENIEVLKAYKNVGLWYPKGAKFELVGYSDLDYAGCKVEWKSTSSTSTLNEGHFE